MATLQFEWKRLALHDGLDSAIQEGFDRLIVKGDNKIAIEALYGKIHILWHIHNIVKDTYVW